MISSGFILSDLSGMYDAPATRVSYDNAMTEGVEHCPPSVIAAMSSSTLPIVPPVMP